MGQCTSVPTPDQDLYHALVRSRESCGVPLAYLMRALRDLKYEFDPVPHVGIVDGNPHECRYVRKKGATSVRCRDLDRDERELRRLLELPHHSQVGRVVGHRPP
jgi:hypothetical protein